jgi:glucokinase
MPDPNLVAIGQDLGGTAIKTALVAPDGRILTKLTTPTEASNGPDHVIARMAEQISQLQSAAAVQSLKIRAVGVGSPGIIDRAQGHVIAPPNLPGWKNIALADRLHQATGLSIHLDNDANNAALGEHLCGIGKGRGDMALLTLGTGVGGGLVLGGKVWRGSSDNAGELGHTIVQAGGRLCGCGQRGCLEAYASANALIANVTAKLASGRHSSLSAAQGSLDCKQIAGAAKSGDPLACEAWADTSRYIAIACVNIHHSMGIESIVLAGGLSEAGPYLRDCVVVAMESLASQMLGELPEVHLATLGNDAGVVGAAMSTGFA